MHVLPMVAAESLAKLVRAQEHDPHRVLGTHRDGEGWVVRVFRPSASAIRIVLQSGAVAMTRVDDTGLFEWRSASPPDGPARLRITERGVTTERIDPYAFPPDLSAGLRAALAEFGAGSTSHAHDLLGAHPETCTGVAGTRFRVWAPNAERVSVVGDFNGWDGRVHPLATLGASGVWELFVPGIVPGTRYKFELRHRGSGAVFLKSDPYARSAEMRPATASVVAAPEAFDWHDDAWMRDRAAAPWLERPMSIYEVHAGSWMRHPDGSFHRWTDLAKHLIPYVKRMGFTHIELMPLTEHPLDESWGYQSTGYFAPTSRFGAPDDLRVFVDACHREGIGVLLDWVPGHFPRDDWALARFDGTALYEHADPRLGEHPDWGTYTFNFARNEVRSFLLSSARYWLESFHFDGLRVDAVASMLYLDYSRKPGEWLPNRHGGRENLEAVAFLRDLNTMVHAECPGAVTIAEESTSWPMVSRPVYLGGLGFSMKWNMGWMHDTLRYLALDPVHRRFHHDALTFGQLYAYSENFVLPLSHDEVVHGKGSLIGKMHGDRWQRFANLRLALTLQMTTPGRKLLFMGGEFAQVREWSERRELDWALTEDPAHAGMQRLVADLNALYRDCPALHALDFSAEGFRWIDCHDADQSVIVFERCDPAGNRVIVVLNFTPVPRHGYRIGVPRPGRYIERFNSDSSHYGGGNVGNGGAIASEDLPWMNRPASIAVVLPPLAGIILAPA